MEDDLTFVIHPEGDSASFALLSRSLEDIRRLLRGVDRAIHGVKSQHEWMVGELRSSAPTIALRPALNGHEADGVEAVHVIGAGLRIVTGGTDQPPPYFTEKALEDLGKMRRLFGGRGRATSIDVIVNREETATIEHDISEKVTRILNAGYRNLGSLEGTLEVISVHGAPTVTIWERVSRSPVRCFFPREDAWIVRAKHLLGKRVAVTGDIRYFVNGRPRSISSVTQIEDATPDPTLLRAEFGSIPDSRVAEMGAAEWLKSIRGVAQ